MVAEREANKSTMREEYCSHETLTAVSSPAVSRREFIKRMGLITGGIIVYCTVGDPTAFARAPRQGQGAKVPTDFNAFLHIDEDGRVACFVGKIEMGQGPITSFAQMMAEELDVAYDSVEMVMGDTDRCPWDAGTWGSLSTRHYGVFVKEAACEAKEILKMLASERLGCPKDRLGIEKGVLFDNKAPAKRVTYGELTRGKRIEKHLDTLPPLKPFSKYTISGKSYPRRDALDKVSGKARYAGDIRLPGMMYAKILRPPAHGARLTAVDTSEAEKLPDVRVIREDDLTAVLHPQMDMAQKAIDLVKAEYDFKNTGINDVTIFDHLLKNAPSPSIVARDGDLQAGEKASRAIIDSTYLNSYVSHAPMEPHTALAAVEDEKITIWASTQSPFGVQGQVAQALDWPMENVRVITPFVGGGFGGKGASAQAVEAARLAKLSGKPVMVVWSREEEFFYDTFRPAAVVKIRSGIDDKGRMTMWDYNVYFAGKRGCDNFYEIPHHREAAYGEWHIGPGIHPFAVGPWRAPAANTNVYARDLQINMMAAQAGKDPLYYRLDHLKDKRMISVLKAVARLFGWSTAPPPSGRGYGISCGIDAETCVALMAEVNVNEKTGDIEVIRVACAQDMGQVVNPRGAALQMEGCITMGLGYALSEEMHFSDGRLLDTNFDTYRLPKFSWLPEIKTVLVPNNALPPKGGGEPAIICMGGVLATAVYDATGAAVFQLPMTPDRVMKALKKRAA